MPRPTEMTRQQLYDLVWDKPMPMVAAGFPMSPITLKKICLKHQVPVPPAGYWSKSETAKLKAKLALPETKVGDHRIWVRRFRRRKAAPQSLPEVSGKPRRWHDCTQRTEQALKEATPDERGALIARGAGVASVNVPPETVDRALDVLDAIIRAVLKLGHSVPSQPSPTTFSIEGAQVPFSIIERFVRHKGPPDAAETRRRESYAASYPKFVQRMDFMNGWLYRPTGKLTVFIGERDEPDLQHRWADGASHRVESLADDMAAQAVAHAEVIKSRRERIRYQVVKRVETERQWRQERERERLHERFARLKKRVDLLERVERVAASLERLRAASADDPSMREFLDWADVQVGILRGYYSEPTIDDI